MPSLILSKRTGCHYLGYFHYSENLNWGRGLDIAVVDALKKIKKYILLFKNVKIGARIFSEKMDHFIRLHCGNTLLTILHIACSKQLWPTENVFMTVCWVWPKLWQPVQWLLSCIRDSLSITMDGKKCLEKVCTVSYAYYEWSHFENLEGVVNNSKAVVSTWGCDSKRGYEPFLDRWSVDILCTQLHYICFIRVLDGGRWDIVGCFKWVT